MGRAVIGASLLEEAFATADRSADRAGIVIRPLTTMADMVAGCEVFDRVWGLGVGEVSEVQPALLRALEHGGSYVVGAFSGEQMVAASVAFHSLSAGEASPGVTSTGREGRYGLHSHITGVLPGLAGGGIGSALKWHQRAWALGHGIDTITWTYDPLIARNSFFNIARLGAEPQEYLVDFYGLMTDELNAGQPSDRVIAVWDLTSAVVAERAAGRFAGRKLAELLEAGVGVRLGRDRNGEPEIHQAHADAMLLAVPADVEGLRRSSPDAALAWRIALRRTLAPLVADPQWQVTDFLTSGWYVLARNSCAGEA